MYKLYFFVAVSAMIFGGLTAQTFYSLSGPCSDDDRDVELIATLGNDLIYADRTEEDTLWRFVADDPLNPIALLTNNFLVDDVSDEYMLLMSGNALYQLNASGDDGSPQLILTAGNNIELALIWNDEYYYTAGSDMGTFNADGLFVFNPLSGTTTELYTSEFAGFIGMDHLDDLVVAYGNTESGKGIVRTDGTLAGTEEYSVLFPDGSEFFRQSNAYVTSDGSRMFFFYGAAEMADGDANVLFVTDGTAEGTDSLGRFRTIAFESYPDPVIKDGVFYFVQTAFESPGGQTESLFRSDGTIDGTINLDATPTSSYLDPQRIFVLNDEVYVIARGLGGGFTLYTTDGVGIFTELTSTVDANVFRDSLVLSHVMGDDDIGLELYQSSEELNDLELLADVVPGAESSVPRQITTGDDVLYFVNSAFNADVQIFAYDTRTNSTPLSAVRIESVNIEPDAGDDSGNITLVFTGNSPVFTLSDGTENTTGIFEDLAAGEYQVTIVDTYGCITVLDNIEVPLANSLTDYRENSLFKLFPNPLAAGETLKIEFSGTGSSTLSFVRVYGPGGRVLNKIHANDSDHLQLNGLPSGLYWLTGHDSQGTTLFGRRVILK